MIVKIFAGPPNYDLSKVYKKDSEEFIIGVDQGAHFLMQNDMKIDLAIGDFDSVTEAQHLEIQEYALETKKYRSRKDYTDLYLALEEVLEMTYDKIIIYGAIGRRFDHSFANLSLLRLGSISIITEDVEMYALQPGRHRIRNKHKYISFFAMENVEGLTIEGFLYEKNKFDLYTDDPLCISNEGEGFVAFEEGLLLVIHQNEK